MNGIHDCGGMHGLGRIDYSPEQTGFREPWELRVEGLYYAIEWTKNIKLTVGFRPAIEKIPPADYLRMSYWQIWYTALLTRLVESGLLTREEIESGRLRDHRKIGEPATPAGAVAGWTNFVDLRQEEKTPPRFSVGTIVRSRNRNPESHTRQPRYTRGRLGTVIRVHGLFDNDEGDDDDQNQTEYVYGVRFSARDLWGEEAPQKDFVHVDLTESQLEPA